MKGNGCLLLIILFLIMSSCSEKTKQDQKKLSIFSVFRKKIDTEFTDSASIDSFLVRHKELKKSAPKILNFYKSRNYKLAWSENGEFIPQADMMVNLVQNVQSDGIRPFGDPNLRQIFRKVKFIKKPQKEEAVKQRKEMDLLLTGLYFEYASEIWEGDQADEEKLGWHIDRKKIQEGRTLEAILSTDKKKADNAFDQYEPLHPEYHLLKQALGEMVEIEKAGGWPIIQMQEKHFFKVGDTSQAIALLKKRLLLSKDYTGAVNTIFDKGLENAVKNFQKRHGLDASGQIGPKTLEVLNVPVKDRIKQIVLNMERWRWIPDLPSDYIWVNIPEFKLHLIDDKKELFDMEVIVGKAATSTPIFNDEIEYIVFSPYWNIPEKIAVDEIVPIIKSDSNYLKDQEMEVLQDNNVINPDSIDWNNIKEEDLRKMSFRQRPGNHNALGNVKFIFPNEYDVYLHDTPSEKLFERTERDFSHGCIRIAEPLKLAQYLLKNDTAWTEEKIEEAMYHGEQQFVKLKEKEPVYIVYFTVWTDKNGILNFRPDIYNHDKKLSKLFFDHQGFIP